MLHMHEVTGSSPVVPTIKRKAFAFLFCSETQVSLAPVRRKVGNTARAQGRAEHPAEGAPTGFRRSPIVPTTKKGKAFVFPFLYIDTGKHCVRKIKVGNTARAQGVRNVTEREPSEEMRGGAKGPTKESQENHCEAVQNVLLKISRYGSRKIYFILQKNTVYQNCDGVLQKRRRKMFILLSVFNPHTHSESDSERRDTHP